jgi:hypothetical protein
MKSAFRRLAAAGLLAVVVTGVSGCVYYGYDPYCAPVVTYYEPAPVVCYEPAVYYSAPVYYGGWCW